MQAIKKLLFISILCLFANNAFAVAGYRYLVGTGNYSSTSSWSLLSGGVTGAPVPTATDTVVLDINSTDLTADAGSLACYAFRCTSGYTGKVTFTVNIDVSQELTLGANMTFTASTTKGFRAAGSGTWTSNGVVVTVLIQNSVTATTTFNGSWTVNGGVTSAMGTWTLTSNTLNINGGTWIMTGAISGTTTLNIGPTGNVAMTGLGAIGNNWTINTSGTLTLFNGVTNFAATGTPTLTYTAGTIVATGSTIALNGSCTLNTNGMSFNNIIYGISGTYTLNSLLTVTGTFGPSTGTGFSPTFAGTAGFNIANLQMLGGGSAKTMTLHSGNTYTVTTSIAIQGTLSNTAQVSASTVNGTKAFIDYTGPISGMKVLYANFQDIDASGGNTIWDFGNSTLSRTVNINASANGPYPPSTIGHTSGY